MPGFVNKWKDKIYYLLVEKNGAIRNEYQGYVHTHQEEHYQHRLTSWKLLLQLNWQYRVLKKPSPVVGNRKVKLPYLEGAESASIKRMDAIHFAKSLLKYDVVSFDIFDTLILRPFARPIDLFMVLAEKFDYPNFYEIRIAQERKAREISKASKGTSEVTIYDIYEQVERQTGIPKEKGIKVEFETELEICFANPYMKRVFDLLKSQGKRIIIISDMYYPADMLQLLLEHCGYTGFGEVFVSCAFGFGKGNGKLFTAVKEFYGEDLSYCHVGDNVNSDIRMAEKYGFDTRYYPNVNELGNKYRATYDGMSDFVGSAYAGIINTHLLNGLQTYSPYYEYGYIYGGLYVFGFCKWIYDHAQNNGVNKVLFLARDGDIYSRIFSKMFPDMPYEYVYWSRMPSIRLEAERNRNDFLLRYVRHRLSDITPISITSILAMLSLEFLVPELSKYQLQGDISLNIDNVERMENMLIDHWDQILEAFKNEGEAAELYLKSLIGDSKKVSVIDIGWAGSGPKTIKWLAEKKWNMDCHVYCLLGCAYSAHPTSILPQIQNRSVESYIFNRQYNRQLEDHHKKTNNSTNNLLFEIFTQSSSPTLEGFSLSERSTFGLRFGFVEVENYGVMQEIHQGIEDFASNYLKRFEAFPYMYNVTGYDAYIPFRMITKDLSFYKKFFSDFVITRNLGFNYETMSMESLGELLQSRRV